MGRWRKNNNVVQPSPGMESDRVNGVTSPGTTDNSTDVKDAVTTSTTDGVTKPVGDMMSARTFGLSDEKGQNINTNVDESPGSATPGSVSQNSMMANRFNVGQQTGTSDIAGTITPNTGTNTVVVPGNQNGSQAPGVSAPGTSFSPVITPGTAPKGGMMDNRFNVAENEERFNGTFQTGPLVGGNPGEKVNREGEEVTYTPSQDIQDVVSSKKGEIQNSVAGLTWEEAMKKNPNVSGMQWVTENPDAPYAMQLYVMKEYGDKTPKQVKKEKRRARWADLVDSLGIFAGNLANYGRAKAGNPIGQPVTSIPGSERRDAKALQDKQERLAMLNEWSTYQKEQRANKAALAAQEAKNQHELEMMLAKENMPSAQAALTKTLQEIENMKKSGQYTEAQIAEKQATVQRILELLPYEKAEKKASVNQKNASASSSRANASYTNKRAKYVSAYGEKTKQEARKLRGENDDNEYPQYGEVTEAELK